MDDMKKWKVFGVRGNYDVWVGERAQITEGGDLIIFGHGSNMLLAAYNAGEWVKVFMVRDDGTDVRFGVGDE
jgi:quercetin dioxygenase-like cupin family protein